MTTTANPAPGTRRATALPSARVGALVAGTALLVMTVLAPVGVLLLDRGQAVPGGLLFALVACLDVTIGLALLPLTMPAGRRLALVAALARVLAGVALLVAAGFAVAGRVATFQDVWDVSLLVFGVHLLALGWLLARSGPAPAWVGWLVVVAGVGYAVDAVADVVALLGGPAGAPTISLVTFVGELVLMVWLLVRGGRPAPSA
ncbi:DUF4386 family protein [Nocardioides bruguierae]|uniref:DUF4386 domain-containing protein n=1 Tax=Nocardioides bruguierae TaxID=2945102 RepID=A0A9X2D9U1_9ACTN|nr:DUF4386 family protein [Nocardioides bruguierae]MCM0621800.1 DUF4386 domain-containing protein [Nocardioides bruguierae]